MSSRTIAGAVAAAVLGLTMAACGSNDEQAGVKIRDAWARVTPPGQMTSAIYFTVSSDKADALTGVWVPKDVANVAELHRTTMASGAVAPAAMRGGVMAGMTGQMTMHPVKQIDVPAGQTTRLKPGGYHVMLMKLARPVKAGQTIPVQLRFEHAGTVTIDATARD